MQLEERLMSIDEIAEWFKMTKKSYQNSSKKKLKELEFYCDFEVVPRKGVKIIKIFNPNIVTYVKQSSSNYQKIKEEFPKQWSNTGYDTCINVATKIYNSREDLNLTIGEETAYNYTCKARNEFYGKPFGMSGSLGKCERRLVKKIGSNGNAVFEEFTQKENEIKNNLLIKYFGSNKEREVLIMKAYESGELSAEEAMEAIRAGMNWSNNRYLDFLNELKEVLNADITRATKIENIINFEEE